MKNTMSISIPALVLGTLLAGCGARGSAAYPPPPNLAAAREYVLGHYRTPIEYVVDKFKDHDLVVLGEFHRLRQDPLLVQSLIPAVDRIGVKCLAIEFANYADQALIDRLVTAPEYDEELARSICLNSFLSIGLGGYREYCDIFKAAWAVNRGHAPGEQGFRVIGINNDADWSVIASREDRENPALRDKALKGQTEGDWAKRVLAELAVGNGKALVYTGSHHAFTRYRQPAVDSGEFAGFVGGRFGNLLFDALGERTFTIFLHSPWYPRSGYDEAQMVLPSDGAMDHLLGTLPADRRSFGCDMNDTPLGLFTGSTGVYSQGYPEFRLADFCDGYICQGPLTDYEAVTPIPEFINDGNLEFARSHFPNPDFRRAGADRLNGAIAGDAQVYRKIFRQGLKDAARIYALY